MTPLRKRILSREPLLGCFLTWPTDGLAELLAISGFDFVVLDTEHGHYSIGVCRAHGACRRWGEDPRDRARPQLPGRGRGGARSRRRSGGNALPARRRGAGRSRRRRVHEVRPAGQARPRRRARESLRNRPLRPLGPRSQRLDGRRDPDRDRRGLERRRGDRRREVGRSPFRRPQRLVAGPRRARSLRRPALRRRDREGRLRRARGRQGRRHHAPDRRSDPRTRRARLHVFTTSDRSLLLQSAAPGAGALGKGNTIGS